jgi:hypothetical protein
VGTVVVGVRSTSALGGGAMFATLAVGVASNAWIRPLGELVAAWATWTLESVIGAVT